MKLHRLTSAWSQIEEAGNIPLFMDATREKMGDAAALVAVAGWIAGRSGRPVTIVQGDQEFQLSNYVLPPGVHAFSGEFPRTGFDVHTLGCGVDGLWYFNAYLATQECNSAPSLRLKPPEIYPGIRLHEGNQRNEVLFCLLTDTDYNNRRELDLTCARRTVDTLRHLGHEVNILSLGKEFPDTLNLSTNEAVERIARAKCVIAGDTGFSHVAAAFGTPLISIYPEWPRFGVGQLVDAIKISEWWQIPAWNVPKQFLPNAPFSRLRVVAMDEEHRWPIGHVVESLHALTVPVTVPGTPMLEASNDSIE